ncbi:MAG TPA: hypothetical protein PLK14_14030 [Sediminibacterium sp.]|nr:MAG: hypothetical protein B7Y11_13190 [Sphingobacteriia bacterium 24-36-13]OZA64685.1 MAG: hypothetical protein B7X72_08460 [Sphingobacteriia bacterium 39-39-8]HQR94073.1 hypothetical protein [Sediminibacterium sp.]HQS56225.1 hypothetical protein [Sediminibacterium sp.]
MFKQPIYIAALFCILMMAALRWQGAVLKTADSPRAIVDLELAKDPEQVQALLNVWSIKDVRLNIQIDFLFIVAYVVFLAMASEGMAAKWTVNSMQFLGWLMARLALVAGFLDVAENLLMLQTIDQSYSPLSLNLTRYAALIKFGFVGLVLLYLLISIPILFKKKAS